MTASRPAVKELSKRLAAAEAELGNAQRKLRRCEKLRAEHKAAIADRDFYRSLVESTNDPSFFINTQGVITYCSPQVSRYGYDLQDVVGRPFTDFLHPDDVARAMEEFKRGLAGEVFPSYFRLVCKDGSIADVEEFGRLHTQGPEPCFVSVLRDISERRQIEEDLRLQSEIVSNMWDGAVVVSATDAKIIYANPRFEAMFGYDPGELNGRNASVLNAPSADKTPEDVAREIMDALKCEGVWVGEVHNVRKDGTLFWGRASISTWNSLRYGTVWVSTHRDITKGKSAEGEIRRLNEDLERRVAQRTAELEAVNRKLKRQMAEREAAEKALRESKERFRSLFRNASVGLYRTTPDGRILMANPALIRMLGYTSFRDLVRRNLEDTGYEPAYARAEFKKRVERDGQVRGSESAWTRHDGTTLFVRESARAVRDEAGNVMYYEGTAEDITDRKRAEDAMRESEERYRTLAESAQEHIFIIDREYRIQYWNAAAEEAMGQGRDAAMGIQITELFPPGVGDRLEHNIRSVLESGQPRAAQDEITFRDRKVWLDTRLTPLRTPKGAISGVLGVARDVTERVKAEEELQKSEQRYRTIYETIPDPVVIYNPETAEIAAVNGVLLTEYGYTREELLGRPISVIIPENEREAFWEMVRKNVRSPAAVCSPIHHHRRKDGSVIWVDVTAAPLELQGRKLRLAIIRDVTQSVKARENIDRQATILASVTDAVAVATEDTTVTYWNTGAQQVFGYSEQEMVGQKSLQGLLRAELDPAAFAREILDAVRANGLWAHNRLPCRHKDGRDLWISTRASALESGPGKALQVLFVSRDVTSEVRLQERLIRAERLAAVGTLASGLAHEMNNLLGGLRGLADVAATNLDLVPRLFETCRAVAERGGAIAGRLNAFARADSPGEESLLDLGTIVTTVIQMMGPAFSQRRIRVLEDVQPVPFTWVNEGKILQILLNLLANASDSIGHDGDIRVTVRHEQQEIIIAVSDTGAGIRPEDMPRLFDPFFTTKSGPGPEGGEPSHLGLGLPESRAIVEGYGGTIDVKSQPGQGAVFTIRLPVRSAPTASSMASPSALPMPPKGTSMLVADDDELMRFWLKDYLEGQGYDVVAVTNGEEAVRACREKPFAYVFLDLLMPGTKDGARSCCEIKKVRPDAKIIIITAFDPSAIPGDCRSAAHAILKKPFGVNDLSAAFAGQGAPA